MKRLAYALLIGTVFGMSLALACAEVFGWR